jgi:hypothetical protein
MFTAFMKSQNLRYLKTILHTIFQTDKELVLYTQEQIIYLSSKDYISFIYVQYRIKKSKMKESS